MILMQETQGSHCKCHFLCPLKEWIICGYPDKAHNYGYGSVRIRIATVAGIIRILPIHVSPYLRAPDAPPVIFRGSKPCRIIVPLAGELCERAV